MSGIAPDHRTGNHHEPQLWPGQTTVISPRADANSQYVCAEDTGAAALIANRKAIGPWEEFDLISD